MSNRKPREGQAPDSPDWVSGPGGPTITQGGVMPGGPEMQSWKRPLKQDHQVEPEGSLEEQAENVRKLADDSKQK